MVPDFSRWGGTAPQGGCQRAVLKGALVLYRLLALSAAALVGGVWLSRKAADRVVRSRMDRAIDLAKSTAIEDLGREASSVAREKFLAILSSLGWKILIIAGLYLLHDGAELTTEGFRISVIAITAYFAVRDLVAAAPHIWRSLIFIRSHAWRPATALQEFIAGLVFDRAYERALDATARPGARRAIALSSFDGEALSREAALAVADVAKSASLRIVRARTLLWLAGMGVVAASYAGFVALALAQP